MGKKCLNKISIRVKILIIYLPILQIYKNVYSVYSAGGFNKMFTFALTSRQKSWFSLV